MIDIEKLKTYIMNRLKPVSTSFFHRDRAKLVLELLNSTSLINPKDKEALAMLITTLHHYIKLAADHHDEKLITIFNEIKLQIKQTIYTEIAEEAIEYARKNIDSSSDIHVTQPSDKSFKKIDVIEIKEERDKYFEHCDEALQLSENPSKIKPDSKKLLDESDLYHIVKAYKKSKIGNCGELAKLAVYFLNTRYGSCLDGLYIYNIVGGDHTFVVIGQIDMKNEKNYKKWSKSVIVCDPWLNATFPASEIEDKLKDYHSQTNSLESFNPQSQQLTMSKSYTESNVSLYKIKKKVLKSIYDSVSNNNTDTELLTKKIADAENIKEMQQIIESDVKIGCLHLLNNNDIDNNKYDNLINYYLK